MSQGSKSILLYIWKLVSIVLPTNKDIMLPLVVVQLYIGLPHWRQIKELFSYYTLDDTININCLKHQSSSSVACGVLDLIIHVVELVSKDDPKDLAKLVLQLRHREHSWLSIQGFPSGHKLWTWGPNVIFRGLWWAMIFYQFKIFQ